MRHPMRAATAFPPSSFEAKTPLAEQPPSLRAVRISIWVYLILLLLEGALRKWALPSLSDPLLLIRDPVVLVIYFFAIRARVFPFNAYVILLGIVGGLSFLFTVLVLYDYIPLKVILVVAGYGFRTDFLHLPLIFVMASVFDLEDVKKIGRWTLLLAIPMAVLMVVAAAAAFAAALTAILTGVRLATHRGAVELLHLIGAEDAAIAWPLQIDALLGGVLGGAIGAAAALLTLLIIGHPMPPDAPASAADWRLWGIAIAVAAVLGLGAMGAARFARNSLSFCAPDANVVASGCGRSCAVASRTW